jgi:hypothetical protein
MPKLKINRINDEIIISFEDFEKNWKIKEEYKEMKLKLGIPYLMDFHNHFTLLNEENIDLISEIKKQLDIDAIYKNNTMLIIGENINKSNIVKDVILQGFRDLKANEDEEILLNHLKIYLFKHNINSYFKSIFQITEDAQGIEPNSYSHWVLYLRDFKLYIDLDGIYEHEEYIQKIITKYNHDRDLVGFISTEPIYDEDEDYCEYTHLLEWFEFCNLSNLMLEDDEFKKHLLSCSIIDLEECPF